MHTVKLIVLFLILGLCYHYFGGIILFLANIIDTVLPYLSVISGLCYHYLGGIILLYASMCAIVHPSYYLAGSYSDLNSGIIPYIASLTYFGFN